MSLKLSRITLVIAIFLVSLSVHVSLLGAKDVQKEDAKAYKQAYNLVLEEKWKEAHKALERFIQSFRRSAWIDDARFWQCYAREKLEYDLEEVFDCYQNFIKAYPKSKWVDDAKTNMVRIAHRLVREGQPKYEAIVKSMKTDEEIEVKMAALYALEDIGDKESLEAVISLYDSTTDTKFRARIIHILEDFDYPEAFAKVKDIALNDPNPALRRRALGTLEDMDGKGVVEVLIKVIRSDPDPQMKKVAIYELGDLEDVTAIPVLTDMRSMKLMSTWPRLQSMLSRTSAVGKCFRL